MNSEKEWLSIEPIICERGRSMRYLRKGFLTGLGLLLAVAPLMSVFAATEVTGIDFATTSDGGVRISLAITGDTPDVSVFATESPARIELDLADTTNLTGSDSVSVGMGSVQKYSAIGAGGRTRLVVDLNNSANYDYTANAGEVVLTITGGAMLPRHPAAVEEAADMA